MRVPITLLTRKGIVSEFEQVSMTDFSRANIFRMTPSHWISGTVLLFTFEIFFQSNIAE